MPLFSIECMQKDMQRLLKINKIKISFVLLQCDTNRTFTTGYTYIIDIIFWQKINIPCTILYLQPIIETTIRQTKLDLRSPGYPISIRGITLKGFGILKLTNEN